MLPEKEQNDLIFEAMQIVTGQSMKLPTKKHLQALLEERTDIHSCLGAMCDCVTDMIPHLYGKHKEGATGYLDDSLDLWEKTRFLDVKDPAWAGKVLAIKPEPAHE